MKREHVLVVLVAGVVAVAATAPVAMRVEVEPLQQAGDYTEVALIIQVAPMDRSRIGSSAIVRIELDEGRVSSGSPMRAVGAEDDGSFRVVVEWPPGEHDLRVAIEDPNREDTGLWVGTVRIPDLSAGAATQKPEEPKSDPDPEVLETATAESPSAPEETESPTPEPASESPSETMDQQTVEPESASAFEDLEPPPTEAPPGPEEVEPPTRESTSEPLSVGTESPAIEPEPEIAHEPPVPPVADHEATVEKTPSDVPAAAAATAAAIAATPESPPSKTPVEPEIAPGPEPEVTASTVDEKPALAEPDIEGPEEPQSDSDVSRRSSEAKPDPVPESAVAEETVAGVEASPGSEPEPEKEETPLVEPIRAGPPAAATVPQTVEPIAPEEQLPAAAPVSADIAARYAEWERADPETREFSVIAMRGRDPAVDLEAGGLRLRIGGSDVEVEKLGGAENAPLLLGLAIDVRPDDAASWSGAQGSLAAITDRAGGGVGRLFVADSGGVGGWGAEPGSRDPDVVSQPTMNVAQQVVASLERFDGERGRSFLVVLTDGRDEPTKDEWQQATDAAGTAGVPILVVALWDDGFSQRTRKNLKKLTVASGGSLFLVQGRSQLASAADRFGRYLDGGYAVRFRTPSAGRGAAPAISVSATDREISIAAPKSIR